MNRGAGHGSIRPWPVATRQRQRWLAFVRPTAELETIPVWIAVGRLAYAVCIGFLLDRLEPASSDLGDKRVDVFDKKEMSGVPRMLGADLDEEVSMRGELPDRLVVIGKKRWWLSQQPFIPVDRRCPMPDRNSREQIHRIKQRRRRSRSP